MYKVLIVDDVLALRQHVTSIIKQAVEAVEIFEATNGQDGVTMFEQHRPDMTVMDIVMPELTGIEAAQKIWEIDPRTKILFWSQFHRESFVRELGKIVPDEAIHGYALKTESDEKLLYAVTSVLVQDNPYIDPIVRNVQQTLKIPDESLNESEYGVLIDLLLGLTDKAIAMRQHISVRGAQNRIFTVSQKLLRGVDGHLKETAGMEVYNSRVRIVLEALRRGIIDVDYIRKFDEELDNWLEYRFKFVKGDHTDSN
jgi:DNA-binding NarL/FixJ family response regulator